MSNRQAAKLQFTKFTLVGIINFILTFLLFSFQLKVLQIHHGLALSVTWVIGIIFSYILNFFFVFQVGQKISFKTSFGKFTFAYVLSFLINLWLLDQLVETFSFDPLLAQIILTPLVVLFNFTSSKYWSLKQKSTT